MWTKTRVTDTLQIQSPIIQGPFGGGLSSVALAAAVSNAGGLGSFGAHHLSAKQIKETVSELRNATRSPFSINLWVPLPGEREQKLSQEQFDRAMKHLRPSFQALGLREPLLAEYAVPNYDEQVDALLEAAPPVFSFIFGIPSAAILKQCRERKIVTMGTVTNVEEAIAMEAAGVDVLVVSGSEAGGHRASFLRPADESPSGAALIPQVRDAVKAPMIAAGGIADGRGIVAAFALGAEAVQVGTAFLLCQESAASPTHREQIRSPNSRATNLSKVFSGRYARGIKNRFMTEMKEHETDVAPYPLQNWLTGTLRKAAGQQGKPEYMGLWAGQNAPLAHHDHAADLMTFLVEDTHRVLAKLARLSR